VVVGRTAVEAVVGERNSEEAVGQTAAEAAAEVGSSAEAVGRTVEAGAASGLVGVQLACYRRKWRSLHLKRILPGSLQGLVQGPGPRGLTLG